MWIAFSSQRRTWSAAQRLPRWIAPWRAILSEYLLPCSLRAKWPYHARTVEAASHVS